MAATAAYGSWRSPITAEMLVKSRVHFGETALDGETLYWVETRPEESGRNVIVARTSNCQLHDVLPPPHSARSLVHEYGGGAFLPSAGTVYFANAEDQRIWRVLPGRTPSAVTAEAKCRFADFVHDHRRNRLIAVCEDHSGADAEPANRIVQVDLGSGHVGTLVEGADFYSTPRVSPDGSRLCWLSWNHPHMPWDHTALFVASFAADGSLGPHRKVSGADDESIFQPSWSPDGTLWFVSDRTNWWNLYCERGGRIEPVLPMAAEFGEAQWDFGLTTYGFEPDGKVVARCTRGGDWRLLRIDPADGTCRPMTLPYTNVVSLQVGDGVAFAQVGSATEPEVLAAIDLASGKYRTIRRSSPSSPDPRYTSVPEPIEFPTEDGATAHAFYYPPANLDYSGLKHEAPPLIVTVHGGPTDAASTQFRLGVQYWTSRGFAVCDVNYGGSTGYGREYRNRLHHSWGVVDVADATSAALFLSKAGKADRSRLIVRGSSAGGYTVLACLTFRDIFSCGTSYFGVSDLTLLRRDFHKFESRYLDWLVGPYPQEQDRYRERSPSEHLARLNRPLLLLHGLGDNVVSPDQAASMADLLARKGTPVAHVTFAGEDHGLRTASGITRAYEAELSFYSQVLGFQLPDPIEPVPICNWPGR
jgi:dipeptidyl aminopeptidase/acylaminoacyl peptidase